MSLAFPNTPTDTTPKEDVVQSSPFWPVIEPKKVRDEMRIDNTITTSRLRHSLIESVVSVNRLLKDLRLEQQANGVKSLADVEAEQIDGESELVFLYRRAVMCFTKADLIEKYQDFDSTGKQPEEKKEMAPNYERDGHFAISDILGLPRVQVDIV